MILDELLAFLQSYVYKMKQLLQKGTLFRTTIFAKLTSALNFFSTFAAMHNYSSYILIFVPQ